MTIKQQIKHEAVWKVSRFHNSILTPHSSLSNSVLLLSLPLCYSLKIRNYRIREKKIFCIYGCFSAYVISKEVENPSLDTIEFLDTYVCISNPHWQNSRTIVFLCNYILISNTIGSFLYVFFLLLAVILAELQEKARRKNWVTEKRT